MNRGPSNGRVGAMKNRLRAEWLAKVNALATLATGQTFKTIPLANGKAGNVPVDQIVAKAVAKGYTTIVRDDGAALYVAIPVKVAAPVAKPEAA